MAHHVIELDQECSACKGTGVYVGMAEQCGAAVVCSKCKGTGESYYRYEYDDFEGRKWQPGIRRVVEANPGICIGEGDRFILEDFGGMPYLDWSEGKPFPPGSEMRKFICPAWWYQTVDYKRKPTWDECPLAGGAFRDCNYFSSKVLCWSRWDAEEALRKFTKRGY